MLTLSMYEQYELLQKIIDNNYGKIITTEQKS